ncbi:MAG: NAD(P)H-binding protein [Flavobacteriaceae bacterium]
MGKNTIKEVPLSVVMLGASGAVGSQVLRSLVAYPQIGSITSLGRRAIPKFSTEKVHQKIIDVFDPKSYLELLPGHDVAICTLGVGQPSKMGKDEFVKIDKLAVIDFAKACKKAGIRHFQLLGSVGANPNSSSFYLRSKGELAKALQAVDFDRLSIFQPSMIITPNNRYGFLQGIMLRVWPLLSPLLLGGLRKYRGIPVASLGKAIAKNVLINNKGFETLHWNKIRELAEGM